MFTVFAGSHVVLIGLMGSGKTTVGRALAARLRLPFVDNDDALAARAGRTARDLESAQGADALHHSEGEVLAAAVARPEPSVIAAAAGAVLEPGAAETLAGCTVVYLRADPEELAARVAAMPDDGRRPFAGPPADVLRDQFRARDDAYRSLASLVIDTTVVAPDETVSLITSAIRE
jgi:shikimate kinase